MENEVEKLIEMPIQVKYGPAPSIVSSENSPIPITMPVQVKYGPIPSSVDAPTPIPITMPVQVKYGPAPSIVSSENPPIAITMPVQVKYGPIPSSVDTPAPIPITMPVQVKYGPAPSIVSSENPPIAITMPIQVKYGPIPSSIDAPAPIPITMPVQVKYGPAPVPPTVPSPVPPTVIGCTPEDIYGNTPSQTDSSSLQNSENENLVVSSASENFDDIINTNSFLEDIKSVIDELDKLHNNSFYVKGTFAEVLSTAAKDLKNDMVSLKKYGEENLLKSMNYVSEYNNNNQKIDENKALLSKINKNEEQELFSKTNEIINTLETRNRKLKDSIETLEKETI